MRALGPGSVSSILKVILDIVFIGLWIVAVLMALAAVLSLVIALAPNLPATLSSNIGGEVHIANAAQAAFELSTAVLYTLGVIVIVGRLRRLFASLTAGDPFHPDNVRRLRVIAIMLGAIELGRYAAAMLSAVLHLQRSDQSFSLTPWFAVLVVLVLSEVFREGARLRREAELTI